MYSSDIAKCTIGMPSINGIMRKRVHHFPRETIKYVFL